MVSKRVVQPKKSQFQADNRLNTPLMSKYALTGASGFLGQLALKRLLDHPEVQEIHVFDVRAPRHVHSNKLFFHRLDLTKDGADAELAAALLDRGVSAFIHGALFPDPGKFTSERREVESIGTFHVLNALAEAKIKRLIVFSSTFVYGADMSNPNFIREEAPLRSSSSHFVRTRVDVERQLQDFKESYPTVQVMTLRFAPVVGPNTTHTMARYFISGLIPKVLGYDPLLQFLHEADATRAILLALQSDRSGVFNIVGRGVLPLSTGIHMSSRFPLGVPPFVVNEVFQLGHSLRLWNLSRQMVPFFKYLCVGDGEKAERELNFVAEYSTRQALKSMIEAHRLRKVGFAMPSSSLGEEKPAAHQHGFERAGV